MFTLIKIYKDVFLIPAAVIDQPVPLLEIMSINIDPNEIATSDQVNEYILENSYRFVGVERVYYLAQHDDQYMFKLFSHGD